MLIETILAAFEMDAILYELREYGCALNAGRWDYIFSTIKKLGALLPDRAQVTMTVPFMRAYTELLVRSCHRRGAHAIGGMAAFIPSRRDPEVNEIALAQGARRQAARVGRRLRRHLGRPSGPRAGRDRGLRRRARDRPNQLERLRDDVERPAPSSSSTSRCRAARSRPRDCASNVSVGARYLDAWLHGTGAAAIDNLMEDVATAEIARSQVWSWVQAGEFGEAEVRRELDHVEAGAEAKRALRRGRARRGACPDFLTLSAYPRLRDS